MLGCVNKAEDNDQCCSYQVSVEHSLTNLRKLCMQSPVSTL